MLYGLRVVSKLVSFKTQCAHVSTWCDLSRRMECALPAATCLGSTPCSLSHVTCRQSKGWRHGECHASPTILCAHACLANKNQRGCLVQPPCVRMAV